MGLGMSHAEWAGLGYPLTRAEVVELGPTLIRDAQALVDCYPESKLSAAQKEHAFRTIEEHPQHAVQIVLSRAKLGYIQSSLQQYPLKEPNRPHGYRGRAEWPAKPTPPVEVDPPPPSAPAVPAEQSAAVADSAGLRSQMDEGGDADELDALLAKKQQ